MSGKLRRNLGAAFSVLGLGLGYIYRALADQRSVKSQLLEDKAKIARFFRHQPSSQDIHQNLLERIDQAKETGLSEQILSRYNIQTLVYPHGLVYELVTDYPDQERVIYYFHDGKRIDSVTMAEWKWLDGMSERLNCRILVPYISPLTVKSMDEEVERLTRLMLDLNEDYGNAESYFIGSDSGCMFALQVAGNLVHDLYIHELILLSPWLDATLSEEGIGASIEADYEQSIAELIAIKEIWSENEPLINLVEMDVSNLPQTAIIGGTDDLHEPATHHFYRRLKKADASSRYYRFDHMPHSFYLKAIPEADEVIGIIESIFIDSRKRKY